METRLKVVGAPSSGSSGYGDSDRGGFYSSQRMETHLTVVGATRSGSPGYGDSDMGGFYSSQASESPVMGENVHAIRVTSGGAAVPILPRPFPLPDRAAPVPKQFGDRPEGVRVTG